MPLSAVHTALEPMEAVAILTFQMGNAMPSSCFVTEVA